MSASEIAVGHHDGGWSDRSLRQPVCAEPDPATQRWLDAVERGEINPSRQTLAELAAEFQVMGTGISLGALAGSHVNNQWLLGGAAGAAVARALWDHWSQQDK